MTKRAVILLSGGLDSVTALAIAKAEGYECFTISFDYGQRHKTELFAAENLAKKSGVASHKVIQIDLRAIGGSALTDDIDVPETEQQGIPITYVPARNTVFLSIALGWAEVLNAEAIFVGVNAVDYSGYPDCRPEFIDAFEKLANLATKSAVEGSAIYIKAPLMHLSKSEIVKRGTELGIDYSETVSCYQADAQGRACGQCDSCRFRRQGFIDAGLADPTRYQ
ncbi:MULTISPECIES: 7-cyano-7-deazaguanine synthase QueC [unclassified Methylophaga]|jgi:7-cyano-7-deazaguanine synthase|uniref:7-cyano-7-deazaguanine synthase QueC n=1 Tax=unclassified Methylophaga TaxID=2629249 RepID=UPI000C412D32|nr:MULTISPECIES: 7-cyano-7-deazaguanine synthase QueC [unclassified Methylophaga]MAL49157.1 7-cyano-7-deazaguanine synthase QueC [Methylophaga sp.]MAP27720.1 7-cyano-7-deazaguanine synthase QueC [Methylophaga sp.]MBP25453.1 7-cyano-7-deazaguanine synthase QueC [Methylophaga sp.]HAD31188.1 7-cyano-7-deazaguanine synthase QueC [Methylophaga sp.]HBX61260.1 7-cyano-7-deazaguanine synthase QueC [Methylophaga sp.]|tara:strand:+ start:631 stop:1299 length:669 start_codon:yes stop_codon:yes gene_type:complete